MKKDHFEAGFSQDFHSGMMKKALGLAQKAMSHNEVPVGAIVVGPEGQILSQGFNLRENKQTPLGHAELIAIHRAAKKLGSWRLLGCSLYVTLEPCVMCSGLLVQSRLEKVVFGAYDPKGGGLRSLYQIGENPKLNHQVEVLGGVLEEECAAILSAFFKKRRSENAQRKKSQT